MANLRNIVLGLVLFCIVMAGRAATYYVATNGNDSADGSVGTPWLTVTNGVAHAVAGDTVLVGAGTYSKEVITKHDGTSGSPIVIDGQGIATMPVWICTNQYNYLFNFTIAGRAGGYWGYLARFAHHSILSNNIFDGAYNTLMAGGCLTWESPQAGELPWGTNCASDCLVVSNTFKRISGDTAIQVYGDRNTILGNRLIDGDAVDWFHVWGRTNRIIGNTCSNAFVSGLDSNHPDFFQAYGLNGVGSAGVIVESNTVIAGHGLNSLGMFEGQDCEFIGDYNSETTCLLV